MSDLALSSSPSSPLQTFRAITSYSCFQLGTEGLHIWHFSLKATGKLTQVNHPGIRWRQKILPQSQATHNIFNFSANSLIKRSQVREKPA